MNMRILAVSALATFILLSGSATFAEGDLRYAVFGAGRYHAENEFAPVAFEVGWSYTVGLEIYEGNGYWQFAVDFADGGTGTVSGAVTPQINLNVNDGGVVGGFGVLWSYVDDEVTGKDWSDVYFQVNLGLDLELGDSVSLIGLAHYTFDDFEDFDEFDTDNIDYTVGLNYKF